MKCYKMQPMPKAKKQNFTYPEDDHCKIRFVPDISQPKSEATYKSTSSTALIQQLEEYRLKNRIPQEDLARSLGVAFSTVNRWINGKTKPNKTQTYHIKKLLQTKSRAI